MSPNIGHQARSGKHSGASLGPHVTEASYTAQLAASLHAAGDRGQAFGEGMRVLSALEGTVRSARILHELHPVRQAAAPGGEFAARYDTALAS